MRTTLAAILMLIAVAAFSPLAAVEVDAKGARKGVWSSDYPAVKAAAEAEKAPLFLLFTGSDWCHWCKLMDKQVFSKPEWQTFAAQNLYLAYLDFPSDKVKQPEELHNQNVRLREDFNVEGYPTMILLDHEGKQLGSFGASQNITAEAFVQKVQQALGDAPDKLEAILKTLPADEADAIRKAADQADQFARKGKEIQEEMQRKEMALQLEAALRFLNLYATYPEQRSTKASILLLQLKDKDAKAHAEFLQLQQKIRDCLANIAEKLKNYPKPETITEDQFTQTFMPLMEQFDQLKQQQRKLLGLEDED